MGNYNTGTVKFQQSVNDFPLTVALGEKSPAFGLSRWGGSKGLWFIPPDDEGYSLRGNKQRLVYKGRRRSHRFTILGDNAFEYDCILLREPESNVISLMMEGVENYNFFRQPDFVPDPFLKGSYAVYKKETLLGEGTGKLCHIHRPEIIDARGRRCWGDLSIVENRLCITVPETWLSEAAYPVVVDPTIGTTTIGSQTPVQYTTDYNNIRIIYQYAVNRFLVPEQLAGNCTAYIYLNESPFDKGSINPILFDEVNGVPKYRRSQNEERLFTRLLNTPPRWKDFSFSVIDTVQGGSNIWFGAYGEGFVTHFDFGGTYYKNFPDQLEIDEDEVIDLPDFPVNSTLKIFNYILSWYFTYESLSKNYIRVLTQGVNLSDSRKLTGDYKRAVIQSVQASTATKGFLTIIRKLQEAAHGLDNVSFDVLFFRTIQEAATINESIRHLGSFFRGLLDTVDTESDTKAGRFYSLTLTDTVHAAGSAFRGLILLVRIVTQVFVRDYLLGRFLKARQELVLKSCVSREISLDSRIG